MNALLLSEAISPVKRIKAAMQARPNIELETLHFLIKPTKDQPIGLYARVVMQPMDATAAGAIHKSEHFYVVSKGRVLITDGMSPAKECTAGDVIISQPGTERVIHAVEDSIYMTVHRTTKTDLAEIEAELVEPDENSPFTIGNKLKALPWHS